MLNNKAYLNQFTSAPRISTFKALQIGNLIVFPLQVLGVGAFSQVLKGQLQGRKVAVKRVGLGSMDEDGADLFQNQITIVKRLDHPNIVKCLDIFYSQNNCYIVFELCTGGSLQSLIEKEGMLTQLRTLEIMQQVLSGYLYMEKRGFVHRDIKPDNILIEGKTFKIADMGFATSQRLNNNPQVRVGTVNYMAPQTYFENLYDNHSDIWSFGVTFIQLLTLRIPFQTPDKLTNWKAFIPKAVSLQFVQLIGSCLKEEPNLRPSGEQLLQKIKELKERTIVQLPSEKARKNVQLKSPTRFGRERVKKPLQSRVNRSRADQSNIQQILKFCNTVNCAIKLLETQSVEVQKHFNKLLLPLLFKATRSLSDCSLKTHAKNLCFQFQINTKDIKQMDILYQLQQRVMQEGTTVELGKLLKEVVDLGYSALVCL